MRIKKNAARSLAIFLAASQCIGPSMAYAGTWESTSPTQWTYRHDDGSYQPGGWFKDPADGRWYYLDQDGVMMFGWQYLDNVWYYLNTVHDGTFGAALSSGWYWIDGYCYYFDQDCKMAAGTVTPDGYTVDTDGHWTENGQPVYIEGKGILTSTGPGGSTSGTSSTIVSPGGSSGGGSSGGGGGGGGGGGSSSVRYYDYTAIYVGQDGNTLATVTGEARRNSFVTIELKSFDGYEYVGGDAGAMKLTEDGQVYTLTYQAVKTDDEETEDPVIDDDPVEAASYRILYIDKETGKVIKEETGEGRLGGVIQIKDTELDGYNAIAGNHYSFTLTEDGMEISLYYTKTEEEKEMFAYTIRYVGDDGTELGSVEGTAEENAEIEIPERDFPGYILSDESDNVFILSKDGMVIEVLYEKIEDEEDASESDADEDLLSYTIRYIDRETNDIILEENGTAEYGSVITPDLTFDGYIQAADYEFEVTEDGSVFVVYLISEDSEDAEPEVEDVNYTVVCVDEEGNVLKTFFGTVSVGNEPVEINPEYEIDGYEMTGSNTFEVVKGEENSFELVYEKIAGDYSFTVICYDIDTMQEISREELFGDAGEVLDISGICPDGYQTIGNPPQSVTVSTVESNNTIKLYFKEIADIPETAKEVPYIIQFRAYRDNDTIISEDITGTWLAGEKLPVYYNRRINTADGRMWEAIDDSPRIFTVKDVETNVFLIEFEHVGDIETPETERTYTIRYVAEDTGSILGIAAGIGNVGDTIAFRNNFEAYGFADDVNSITLSEDEDANDITVMMKRIRFPGHEVNENTGLYDGREWTAIFTDSAGNQLLPSMDGFTVKGDYLTVDYPDIIEQGGVTYRAVKSSPYRELVNSTTYEQIVIQYITGDSSETKLQQWKDAAQAKKDEFYGTTPYSYYIPYKELNSWNDIGLKFGVANAGTEVELEAEDFPGWIPPTSDLGSFTLDEDGKQEIVQYEKSGGTTSAGFYKRPYTIRFVDEEGNELFDSYTGNLAFAKANGSLDFQVYYPDSFYDAQGNRWEADVTSPQNFVMSAMETNEKTISYHKVYENEGTMFIVESNNDVNRILNDFATHTLDSSRHEFYLIGKGYNPNTAEVSDTMYKNNLAGYTNEVVDTFELNGETYTVVLVGYYHKWDQGTCTHEWEYVEQLHGNCLTAEKETVRCIKCGKEEEVIVAATGHVDENYDSVCDVCGIQLSRNIGDEITVVWDSGDRGFGEISYDFVCIDNDYQGTGKMLYIAMSGIAPSIYGTYTTSTTADFESSRLKYFLNDEFADGLSVSGALQAIDDSAVTMLTKEEYDAYRAACLNKFPFPTGTYLTKSEDENSVMLTNGTAVTKEEASSYSALPAILLNPSDEQEGIQGGVWHEGDMQAREIGGKLYLFRCVDANYMDKTHTDKSLALFVCDTIIPANEGMGYDEITGLQDTRFFGDTNNYKYSTINEWLVENSGNTNNMLSTNIGIQNEYSGSTAARSYENLDVRDLTRHTRSNPQVMYSQLFIPSVEEAIAMKDYLWKFNGSNANNAEEVITPYCRSYWLRTPEYGTDDMVYTVNLENGTIEPKSVKAESADNYSSTGIRPVYVMEQSGS